MGSNAITFYLDSKKQAVYNHYIMEIREKTRDFVKEKIQEKISGTINNEVKNNAMEKIR